MKLKSLRVRGEFLEQIVPPVENPKAPTKPLVCGFWLPRDGVAPEPWNHWPEASGCLQAQQKIPSPFVWFQAHGLIQLLGNLWVSGKPSRSPSIT